MQLERPPSRQIRREKAKGRAIFPLVNDTGIQMSIKCPCTKGGKNNYKCFITSSDLKEEEIQPTRSMSLGTVRADDHNPGKNSQTVGKFRNNHNM